MSITDEQLQILDNIVTKVEEFSRTNTYNFDTQKNITLYVIEIDIGELE